MGGGPTPSWAPAQGTFPARPWPLPTIEAGQAPTPTPNASPLRLPSVLSHPAQARVKVTVCFHCHACHDSLGPCLPASLLRPAGHPGQRGWTPMLPCHFRGRVSVQVRRPVHLTGGEARGGRADAQGLGSQARPREAGRLSAPPRGYLVGMKASSLASGRRTSLRRFKATSRISGRESTLSSGESSRGPTPTSMGKSLPAGAIKPPGETTNPLWLPLVPLPGPITINFKEAPSYSWNLAGA